MFKLVIQDDEGKTTVVPLIRDEITIGRKEGNTIRLTERNVSRRHARILRNNGEVQIEDLGSYNGIRVNNARIAERVSLRISDQVQIGDYKLYLKAEGVEQVDDARTMPIERIDTRPRPGDRRRSRPAGRADPPIPVPTAAGTGANLGTARRHGAWPIPIPRAVRSHRSAGRRAHRDGRLRKARRGVVELRRQRIRARHGRDDHRPHRRERHRHQPPINQPQPREDHARSRDRRYTISRLQSSNGVRVNGQDYGKVELRRGDMVDLGHVRLRFVEPGEDFVFARDAVDPTMSPRPAANARMLIAVVLGDRRARRRRRVTSRSARTAETTSHRRKRRLGAGERLEQCRRRDRDRMSPNPGSNGGNGSQAVVVDTPDRRPSRSITSSAGSRVECLGDMTDKKWRTSRAARTSCTSSDPATEKQYKDKAAASSRTRHPQQDDRSDQ